MSDFGRMPNFDTHGFSWPGGPDYEPPPPPRCYDCGGFLPWTPTSQEPWEDTIECDGSATADVAEREGALLDILGPGSDTYWMSPCGDAGGQHEPHTEVMAAGVTFRTVCPKCGTKNVDNGL
jgi:hypothetical protein